MFKSSQYFPKQIKLVDFCIMIALLIAVLLMMIGTALVIDRHALVRHVRSVDLQLACILLILSTSNYFFRIIRWQVMSQHLNIKVHVWDTVIFYIAGLSMGATPGKIGEALRLWFLQRRYSLRYERTVPLFIGDRLSDIYSMMILCLLGATAFLDYFWSTLLIVIFVLLITYIFARPKLLIILTGSAFVLTGRRYPAVFANIRRSLHLTKKFFNVRIIVNSLLLGVCAWFAECYAFYWLLLNLEVAIGLQQAVFIYAFATVGGALSMMPGGLGGFEAITIALLTVIETPIATSLAAVTIIRLFTLWYSIAIGCAFLHVALQIVLKNTKGENFTAR